MDKDKLILVIKCLMLDLKDAIRTLDENVPDCYNQSIEEAEEMLELLEVE